MDLSSKSPVLTGKNALIFLVMLGISVGLSANFKFGVQEAEAGLSIEERPENEAIIFQQNTLAPISNHFGPEPKVIRKVNAIITAYSSSPLETDDSPYLTAAGTWVKDGIIANNYFSMGTKIRIPELYGDKIFVVEDRMSWKKGNYHFDIWFPNYWDALNFGAKTTYIEILES